MIDVHKMMDVAEQMRKFSDDPSTQVGACLGASGFHPVCGYNHVPALIQRGRKELLLDRDRKYKLTVHAELDVILKAKGLWWKGQLGGATLCTTHHPCCGCAAHIIEQNIKTVIYKPQPEFDERWAESCREAADLMKQQGVRLEIYIP